MAEVIVEPAKPMSQSNTVKAMVAAFIVYAGGRFLPPELITPEAVDVVTAFILLIVGWMFKKSINKTQTAAAAAAKASLLLCLLFLPIGLTGCAARVDGRIPSYTPGQNFGPGGVRCLDQNGIPYRTTVKGSVPWCAIPNDGTPEWTP